MSIPWVIRPFEADDENCCVSMWLKSYAHAREVSDAGFRKASVDGSDDELRYWSTHQPIVSALLGSSEVRVACDPARVATGDDGGPSVIWAWACVGPDSVHWVGVKRSVVRAGLGEDIVHNLLGDRIDREQTVTFELTDLKRIGLHPEKWRRDRGWLSGLRELSSRVLDGDRAYSALAAHLLDPRREAWRPGVAR